jgi:hypothetical protein
VRTSFTGHKFRKISAFCSVLVLLLIIFGCGAETGGGSDETDVETGGGSSETEPGSTSISSVTLAWDAPTTYTDGASLSDLAGYKIYYGSSSGNYSQSIDIGNYTDTVVNNLSPGTWCFVVTAYNASGSESNFSNEICKIINYS